MPDPSFSFLCVSDLHCLDVECADWLNRQVVPSMRETVRTASTPIDFCLVLGDLAENATDEEFAMARDALQRIGVPLYPVPGNHDYTADDKRETFDRLFPGSVNYAFTHKGWQFIGLDTTDGRRYDGTAVPDATLRWLDEHVPALDPGLPTVVFTHFPLAASVRYCPTNAGSLLDRLHGLNLRAVLSGHFHGTTSVPFGQAVLTTGPCCALKRNNHDRSPAKGYCVWTARGATPTHRFVEVPTEPLTSPAGR